MRQPVECVEEGQDANLAAVEQRIVDEVHRPNLVGCGSRRAILAQLRLDGIGGTATEDVGAGWAQPATASNTITGPTRLNDRNSRVEFARILYLKHRDFRNLAPSTDHFFLVAYM
jgi:hypothetical protein